MSEPPARTASEAGRAGGVSGRRSGGGGPGEWGLPLEGGVGWVGGSPRAERARVGGGTCGGP